MTGEPRALQVDQALASVNFGESVAGLVRPLLETTSPVERALLFDCQPFRLWRLGGESPFVVGAIDLPRVLVCLDGKGAIEHGGVTYEVCKGEVWLLPAVVGRCAFRPGGVVTLLEIALPESMHADPVNGAFALAQPMEPEETWGE